MKNKLYTIKEVTDFINQGKVMLLTGSDKTLAHLPKGKWIAGTGPYVMDGIGKINADGYGVKGKFDPKAGPYVVEQAQPSELIFVDDFTDYAEEVRIEELDETNIHEIAKRGYENGFVVVTFPIESKVYTEFANNSLNYEDIFNNPVVGYVSGCLFEDIGKVRPKIATGINGKLTDSKAAVMYIKLPANKIARTEIMNFDTINPDSPQIVFPKTSFVQTDCTVDGKPANIADVLESIKAKIGYYPQLITDMNGALVNRDIKIVDLQKKEVSFFSPVYEGDVYARVKENDNYQKCFNDQLVKKKNVIACFSCASYFMAGKFEGKTIDFNGVYAFGEIGYQLLNKTIVTLEIDEV